MAAKDDGFIQERLDSLHDIDCRIVSLLDNLSMLFDTYSTPTNDKESSKAVVVDQTKSIYATLSEVAISLRKEIKIMDDNIGVYDRNSDNIMILPIQVDQKNTTLGKRRLVEELKELETLTRTNTDTDLAGGSAVDKTV